MMPELPPESLVVSRHALDDGDIWVNEKGCKAGIVEVFANQGSVCGTRRYYSCSQLTRIQLSGAPAQLTQYRSTYSQE